MTIEIVNKTNTNKCRDAARCISTVGKRSSRFFVAKSKNKSSSK